MEEEAVGCDDISPASPVLAVSTAGRSGACSSTDPAGEGTETGVQSQARVCSVQDQDPSWMQEEAGAERSHLREAEVGGSESAEAEEESSSSG